MQILSSKDPKLMLRNKTLAESLAVDPAWANSQFFKKFLKEAILEGNITDETPNVAATQELLAQIMMGAEAYTPLDFAHLYNTDKAQLLIPVGTYGTAVEISTGAFTNSPKTQAEVTINLDKEYGTTVTWTRAHLEDATWDVMSEQNQGAGYAIQHCLHTLLLAALLDGATGATFVGAFATGYTTWLDWMTFLSKIDVAEYGPADYCLVPPSIYWQLLNMDQFVNSLYAGSDEVMRTGVAKTMFGITFIKTIDMAYPIAVNSKKCIALAYRRQLTVEPFEHPELNQYGFIASVRAKEGMLNRLAGAVARD